MTCYQFVAHCKRKHYSFRIESLQSAKIYESADHLIPVHFGKTADFSLFLIISHKQGNDATNIQGNWWERRRIKEEQGKDD